MFTTDISSSKKFQIPFTVFPGTVLAFLYFLALLPWLGKNRLLGLDESIYADIILSASRDGHWWPLIFHGQPFWDKPPFLFWLQAFTVKLLGANEFSLRLWPALTGALCVYYVTRLGTVLGKSLRAGMCCGFLLILQKHFILYSRVSTLDMALLSCLLGGWWHFTKAFNPPSKSEADKELLYAGLWLMAGVAVKSWYGFVLMPALILALGFCSPWPFSAKKVFAFLLMPSILLMAGWVICNIVSFGTPYLNWAWGYDLMGRSHGGSLGSLSKLQHHLDFYGILAQEGMPFLWPLLPLCFFLWLRDSWHQARQGYFDSTSVIGTSFFFYYLFFILIFIATFINYILPLLPLAVLSLTFLYRYRDDRRVVLAVLLAVLMGILNGFGGDFFVEWVLAGSFVSCLLLVLSSSWGLSKEWLPLFLVVLFLACGIKTQSYWRNPPDPNRAWVWAVLTHPAVYPGEPLYFVGEETDARVLEFYSDYQVFPLAQLPTLQPDGAILFQYQKQVFFLPYPQKALRVRDSGVKGNISLKK